MRSGIGQFEYLSFIAFVAFIALEARNYARRVGKKGRLFTKKSKYFRPFLAWCGGIGGARSGQLAGVLLLVLGIN